MILFCAPTIIVCICSAGCRHWIVTSVLNYSYTKWSDSHKIIHNKQIQRKFLIIGIQFIIHTDIHNNKPTWIFDQNPLKHTNNNIQKKNEICISYVFISFNIITIIMMVTITKFQLHWFLTKRNSLWLLLFWLIPIIMMIWVTSNVLEIRIISEAMLNRS